MAVTDKGLAVIRSFEGRALKAYKDSVGVITIGYGNTNYDKFAVEYLGGPIKLGMSITEEQADYLLIHSLAANYTPQVEKVMKGASLVELDGGVSFHYNTGAIARAGWVKQWAAKTPFYAAIMSWNKAGGKVLNGLTRRRAREYAIIHSGDYGPEGRTAPPVLNAAGSVVGVVAAKAIPVTSKDHPLTGTPGMLKLGDRGPEVADFNDSLLKLGFKINKGEWFDGATDKAVRSFQASHTQLDVDGVAGPATRAAITREADAKKAIVVTTATGTGSAASTATGSALSGFHLPPTVYIVIAVFTLAAICFYAWKYRDELAALGKRT